MPDSIAENTAVKDQPKSEPSAWAPFKRPAFVVLWTATVISNIGTWMHDVGAGWLMTELAPSPLVVAAVQAATTLPVFLFALIAGAVADIYDRRKLLILVNALMGLTAAALAVLVYLDAMTPTLLLVFTFALGAGAAFVAPAWQAIVPKLVPKAELQSAIAFNSMGINVSRAIGPAVAGFLIVAVSLAAPFALNAISFLVIIAALIWWKPEQVASPAHPPERVFAAIRIGLNYALYSPPLKATLIRAFAFFVFASAYWAMLPLIARDVLQGGANLYGLLMAAVGAGAVAGALLLPKVKKRLGADRTVAAGTIGTAIVLGLFAIVPNQYAAIVAAALGGFSWIAVLSSLHVSAQTALPDWVRARGLSIFLTVFFGSMAAGSLAWGKMASVYGIETSLIAAAIGALLGMALTWRVRLNQGMSMDHAPAQHWPEPVLISDAETDPDRGPVMIQITYHVAEENHQTFRDRMAELARERKRHGGYHWSLMQSSDEPNQFIETWYETSWLAHLRHHDRVSKEEQRLQAEVQALHLGPNRPKAQHFLHAENSV